MDWLPAITTTSLLGIVIWLAKNSILERLRASIQHEFNQKLEMIKTELREKENQIAALRNGALSGASHRQTKLYEKRLEAAEELWSTVTSMAGAKSISYMMAHIKFVAAAKETAKNPQAREIFKAIGKSFDQAKMDFSPAHKARPFVSKLAWAYYAAYQAIVSQSIIRLESLKAGTEEDYSKTKEIIALVKVALPHHENYIETHAENTLHYLLDELEEKILNEIGHVLDGKSDDHASLITAASIVKASEELMANKKPL